MALTNRKSDNNTNTDTKNNKKNNKKTLVALGDPFPGTKTASRQPWGKAAASRTTIYTSLENPLFGARVGYLSPVETGL